MSTAAYLKYLSEEERAALMSVPSIPPPAGTTPNFVDPPDRASLQVKTSSALLGVALLFFLNRIYVKACLVRRFQWDDATLLLTMARFLMASSLVYHAACTWAVMKGNMGRHLWDISVFQANAPNLVIPSYVMFFLPSFIFVFLKASFFLLYMQTFLLVQWVRIWSIAGLIYITAVHSIIGIYALIIASPYNTAWSTEAEKTGVAGAILGLLVDIVILVIPIVAVSRTKLTRKKKLGALALFTTGALACLCAAFSIDVRVHMRQSRDKTWKNVMVNLANIAEISAGIICASAPATAYGFKNTKSIYRRLYRSTRNFHNSVFSTRNSSGVDGSARNTLIISRQYSPVDMMKSTDKKYDMYFKEADKIMMASDLEKNEIQAPQLAKVTGTKRPSPNMI
ncbi:hypothetical protein CC78DRAFT_581978 [Lojkania enalia]|uniref:Rhodopsin domain-containing protein n=1 Tax=Lojkania enalia TaxID=147567 RepID=A0A9P4K773_9PLEO|nr:hypothetical protein CC78DRAFT_581978 [Didymosphaeria enalia]